MEVHWCKLHRFCALNGQLRHCLAQNSHLGCKNLTQIQTTNQHPENCIYKNGYITPEEVNQNDRRLMGFYYCDLCSFSPQNENLARCLNQNKKNGCIHLQKLLTRHPDNTTNGNKSDRKLLKKFWKKRKRVCKFQEIFKNNLRYRRNRKNNRRNHRRKSRS